MYLTSTSKTTTKKSDKNMSKSLPTTKKSMQSIFPKNASKEPILHWYQWQVHKVPSRPMVLLWNPASLVPKPIQQLILDHPGSRGFRMGGSSLETSSDVDVVLKFRVFMVGSLDVGLYLWKSNWYRCCGMLPVDPNGFYCPKRRVRSSLLMSDSCVCLPI